MNQWINEVPVNLVAVLMDASKHGLKDPSYGQGVYSFPQTWASTALGFGGMGGAAMTTAQTTAILSDNGFLVYFGYRYAYTMSRTEGIECIKALRFPPVYEYVKEATT